MNLQRARLALDMISSEIDSVRTRMDSFSGPLVDSVVTACKSLEEGLFDVRNELSEMVEKIGRGGPEGGSSGPRLSSNRLLAARWLDEELQRWHRLLDKLKASGETDETARQLHVICLEAGVALLRAGAEFNESIKGGSA
jgi:hypothetical protein